MVVGAIVMVLLGCADDGDQCQRVAQLPVAYANVAACNAAMVRELPRHSDIEYPVVAARCESAPPGPPQVIAAR